MVDAFVVKEGGRVHGNGYAFPELSTLVDSAVITNVLNFQRVPPCHGGSSMSCACSL
jgi:hypothetical protein